MFRGPGARRAFKAMGDVASKTGKTMGGVGKDFLADQATDHLLGQGGLQARGDLNNALMVHSAGGSKRGMATQILNAVTSNMMSNNEEHERTSINALKVANFQSIISAPERLQASQSSFLGKDFDSPIKAKELNAVLREANNNEAPRKQGGLFFSSQNPYAKSPVKFNTTPKNATLAKEDGNSVEEPSTRRRNKI